MNRREVPGAIVITGVLLYTLLLCGCMGEGTAQSLNLSDIPGTIAGDVLLVTGEEIPEEEAIAARELAAYLNATGLIRLNLTEHSALNRTELHKNHLIVLGTPGMNPLVAEVVNLRGEGDTAGGNEGEGRLLLLRNPWNTDNLTLVVTGADTWGVRAAAEALRRPENLSGTDLVVPSKIIDITGRITYLSFGSAAAWVIWSDDAEIYLLQGTGAEEAVARGEGALVAITGYPTVTTMTIPEAGEMIRHQTKAIEVIRTEDLSPDL